MAISDEKFVDVLEDIDELSIPQSYKVLMRLKECPPEGTDVVREAIASFDALDDLQIYKFIKDIRTRFDEETWETLVE